MEYKIYPSIEEMTQPEVLSSLVQQPVTRTCLKPFETAGFSSTESKFLTVDDCRSERPRYIIKRLRKEHAFILDRLAAFHAAFWQDDSLHNPKLNLCRLEDFLSDMSSNKIERIAATMDIFVLDMILEGRRLLPQLIDADLANLLNTLANDPAPLCAALDHYPKTLTKK